MYNSRYQEECRNGASRIFHLQPAGVTIYDPEAQKRYGSTVQLMNAPQGWYVSQHLGYRNREPDATETRWADQLLAALKNDHQSRNAPTH